MTATQQSVQHEGTVQARPVMDVEALNVSFTTTGGMLPVVRDLSLSIGRGEVVALVGESGSGKSTIGHALMGLLPRGSQARVDGTIWMTDKAGKRTNLQAFSERQWRKVRGNEISMIFQEPMSSLNPVFTIGSQIEEAIRTHRSVTRAEAADESLGMLEALGLPSPKKTFSSYPHEISGGMRQRVMIAIALVCRPSLLIADEPTTALDVTVQAQIIELLKAQQAATGMAMLFITHDLGLVSEIADRTTVLYAGEAVEHAPIPDLFERPRMPYTQALMRSIPELGCSSIPDYRLEPIRGQVVAPKDYDSGCAFRARCEHRVDAICELRQPLESADEPRHLVRCRRWPQIAAENAL